jgi:hypothetical protein
MTIKAIETVYKGYRFRSRLEARWAVFFDTAGITYQYEPEGFDLGEAGYYLPDFWLPGLKYWFEVKGQAPNPDEIFKSALLAFETGIQTFIAAGEIGIPEKIHSGHGVRYQGAFMRQLNFTFGHMGRPLSIEYLKELANLKGPWNQFEAWGQCVNCQSLQIAWEGLSNWASKNWRENTELKCAYCKTLKPLDPHSKVLSAAYNAARQARFEHGETPGTEPKRRLRRKHYPTKEECFKHAKDLA